jgi:hypothetical protein
LLSRERSSENAPEIYQGGTESKGGWYKASDKARAMRGSSPERIESRRKERERSGPPDA